MKDKDSILLEQAYNQINEARFDDEYGDHPSRAPESDTPDQSQLALNDGKFYGVLFTDDGPGFTSVSEREEFDSYARARDWVLSHVQGARPITPREFEFFGLDDVFSHLDIRSFWMGDDQRIGAVIPVEEYPS